MEEGNHGISVVVPVLDDHEALRSILRQLREVSSSLEVIVADGEASDKARDICLEHGAVWVPSPEGRGVQMNRGAAASRGKILWFLHADSVISSSSLRVIAVALKDPRVVAGVFRFRLQQRHWYAVLLDIGVYLRSRVLKLPYGDQGLFVRRSVFESAGGYKEIPFLEDVEFVRTLRGRGDVFHSRVSIGVSARRWEREGFLYGTLRNWLTMTAYSLGVAPERLANWYGPEHTATREIKGVVRLRPARLRRENPSPRPWADR